MSIVVTIDGDQRVIQRFDEAVKKIGSPREVLEDVGTVMVDEYTDNFPAEGARLDKRWAELAESTKRQRVRLGYGIGPILQRTGTLMNGFQKELSKFAVRVHNPVKYFQYHQLGGSNLPQRKMIVFPEKLKQEVVAKFNEFIHKALNG